MTAFNEIAAFVEMAHNIVWCTTATVDAKRRPRSRVLHPLWQWEGETLTGWIATIRRRDDSGMGKRRISPFCGVKTRSLAAVMPGSVMIEGKVDLLLNWQEA